MVNTIGGKGYKKGKKGGARNKNPTAKFDTNDGYHHYGQVIQILGGNRLNIKLTNDVNVQAVIPGKFMNKVWFRKDDYVVLKEENNFYDIVQKITSSEIQSIASNSLCTKLDKDDYNIYQTELGKNESDEEDFNEILNKDAKITKISTTATTTPAPIKKPIIDSSDEDSSDEDSSDEDTEDNNKKSSINASNIDALDDIKNFMNL
jgi:translation initiation factor IF-1